METLHLVLKTKWYNMIESGEKTEEYRENNAYWANRLNNGNRGFISEKYREHFDTVRFHKGYSNTTMVFQITGITIGRGRTEWGAPADRDVFIIKLGEKL